MSSSWTAISIPGLRSVQAPPAVDAQDVESCLITHIPRLFAECRKRPEMTTAEAAA